MPDYETLARDRDKNLRTGALVTLKPAYATRISTLTAATLLVVIADKFEKANCVLLGGDPSGKGRYWRIPATWVQVIDPASVEIRVSV